MQKPYINYPPACPHHALTAPKWASTFERMFTPDRQRQIFNHRILLVTGARPSLVKNVSLALVLVLITCGGAG